MSKPFLMVAPNGAHKTKANHPALPVTLAETIATAVACHTAGADGLHLHIRDAAGQHSLDAGRYREALSELARVVPTMRVQITTESAAVFRPDEQLKCLQELRPNWASVAIREIAKASELADHVYGSCFDNNTDVQHILYDAADVALLQEWQAKGIVRPTQSSVIYVLGRYTNGQTSDPEALQSFLTAHQDRKDWMLCAFGPQEHSCLIKAAKHGGTLRVGFENSLVNASGTPHRDNAASVSALNSALQELLP
ncbi:3-keto-5-aminohexanoate cleavage protein [uncultured Lentibacter sp.]|uniref:3-keto-5-aminohexanoate cleavage protein n=1 Tax=uncultured Lentibacter sp. TaxID=1659309 RepID=UPI00260C1042|nr:3-keto-5-aminohexanoate cleavage protein [uncultured Lentibacter sp.]